VIRLIRKKQMQNTRQEKPRKPGEGLSEAELSDFFGRKLQDRGRKAKFSEGTEMCDSEKVRR
jgi:hypothetical protein